MAAEPTLQTLLEPERGRWWVVFVVTFPAADGGAPTVVRRPIASYPTQRAARLAARWMRRGADRAFDGLRPDA